ncbi:hypothetical protein LTR91_020892 [Friedmanniomyces endolithicus]|uniref:DM2 domain-containing protein n=1 Tax=Friedmanniomyces endolithicus TaxID=329885 RepID=A0AAN6HB64_9PEZI|nr:hypothetical protein LTR35_006669 [Friedmanniomyces endolithicus]KAK0297067.1 hypothetical protein LTS00_004346 [Friedmanniomyces endolithicus]KAK0320723.1 hypothetical protein LTR82_008436 [Friedmanniomyces endolithicus]KAK0833699.1 hypothetical protein LTR73_001462 [Friedmanniomyces endolithicus]KAK0928128.1 hypothetical protein LTR57_002862 [Friedmanniomyces endolithicus]
MAAELLPEQRASYSAIIDSILNSADLDTISAKAIRKELQAKVEYDLTEQKEVITSLIMERFDKVQRERAARTNDNAVKPAPPTANGIAHTEKATNGAAGKSESVSASPSHKRKADDSDDSDSLSDVKDSPPPKKIRKAVKSKSEPETDEQIARRLQAEFSAGTGRATRGGATNKKKPIVKKAGKTKKKSATKVHSDDDSAVESSGSPKPEKEKKGGFHKLMNLSEPLQALLGVSQLSRPQTVKQIWAYVKERELQDPSDKRQIRCDEPMRAVFKSDKVHMFTMNKILSPQLYPAEEM